MTGNTAANAKAEVLAHEKPERRAEMAGARAVATGTPTVICIAQEDLPLVERPFAAQAASIGGTEDELLATLQSFKDRKLMRRFAAVMNHRSAGFKANAMGVWAVPEDQLEEIGPQMAGFAAVSHCYKRPTYEDWPYTVFTMVHGRTGKDCEATIDAIRDETGVDEYDLLWSIKEYKKVRLRYYGPEWDEWRAEHLAPTAERPRAERRRGTRRRLRRRRRRRPAARGPSAIPTAATPATMPIVLPLGNARRRTRVDRLEDRLLVRVRRLPSPSACKPVGRDDPREDEVRARRSAGRRRRRSTRAAAARAAATSAGSAGTTARGTSASSASAPSQPSAATLSTPGWSSRTTSASARTTSSTCTTWNGGVAPRTRTRAGPGEQAGPEVLRRPAPSTGAARSVVIVTAGMVVLPLGQHPLDLGRVHRRRRSPGSAAAARPR